MNRRLMVAVIAGLALTLAACSAGADGSADRTIRVRMFDDMRYEPDRIEVAAGETVRFEVRNMGQIRHEFFVGTLGEHRDHAEEMRHGGHTDEAHDNPAAVRVEPGETGVLEYTFSEPGELLAGCHEPGHYEAGMVAPISVHPGR
jgi:uncharacterized cupredoxin-like copper-binding protein